MADLSHVAHHLWEDVTDGTTKNLRFKTGDGAVTALLSCEAGGQAQMGFRTGATFTDGGSEETIRERNDLYDETVQSTFYTSPTVDDNGTCMDDVFIPGGGKQSAPIGGEGNVPDPVTCSPNTEYLLQVTNTSGGAIDIHAKILFAEEH